MRALLREIIHWLDVRRGIAAGRGGNIASGGYLEAGRIFFLEPAGQAPRPTVVLLHGNQDGCLPDARDFVKWGVLEQLSRRGHFAVAVSQPGSRGCMGPAGSCGSFSREGLLE